MSQVVMILYCTRMQHAVSTVHLSRKCPLWNTIGHLMHKYTTRTQTQIMDGHLPHPEHSATWMGLCLVQVAICRLSGSHDRPSRVIVKPFTLSPPHTRWFIVITPNVHLADGRTSPRGWYTLASACVYVCVSGIAPSSGSNNYNNHHTDDHKNFIFKCDLFITKSKSKTCTAALDFTFYLLNQHFCKFHPRNLYHTLHCVALLRPPTTSFQFFH